MIDLSPNKFEVADVSKIGSKMIILSQLPQMNRYDYITVKAKVMKVNDIEFVGSGKQKQDVVIGDATGSTVLTLWEEDTHKLEVEKSYDFGRLLVQQFKGNNYLSFSKTATALPTDDIEDAIDEEPQEPAGYTTMENVEIVYVSDL